MENPLNIKSNKNNVLSIFLIILSLTFGFFQVINFSRKNQIISNKNVFGEDNIDDLKITAIIQSDWEFTTGIDGLTCTINKPLGTQEGDLLILHNTIDDGSSLNGPFG